MENEDRHWKGDNSSAFSYWKRGFPLLLRNWKGDTSPVDWPVPILVGLQHFLRLNLGLIFSRSKVDFPGFSQLVADLHLPKSQDLAQKIK